MNAALAPQRHPKTARCHPIATVVGMPSGFGRSLHFAVQARRQLTGDRGICDRDSDSTEVR
jgi:hypothetical protein